jgi:hypothetical protein
MRIGRASFSRQDVIKMGTFDAMASRECALTAFPFNCRSKEQKKITRFENYRSTAQFASEQISTLHLLCRLARLILLQWKPSRIRHVVIRRSLQCDKNADVRVGAAVATD